MCAYSALWVTSSKADVSRKGKWLLQNGSLTINVIHKSEYVASLSSTIDLMRSIYVGSDARFPQLNIFMTIESFSRETLELICTKDTSVPPIKLFLVTNRSSFEENSFQDVGSACRKRYISCKWIYMLNDTDLANGSIPNVPGLIYEMFPNQTDEWGQRIYTNLIDWLISINYDFFAHPLMLRGAISAISRHAILCKYELSVDMMSHVEKPTQLVELPNYITRNSLGCFNKAVVELMGTEDGIDQDCDIGFDMEVSAEQMKKFRSGYPSNDNDYRLFEDWQYIYDGFDFT